jgi:predicted NAD/FAD-binding protein
MRTNLVSRIAVIGSGISGLAAAYYLSRKHGVFLFEREARLGGHTHTVTVESSHGPLAVDTGFIVHNDRTYPNLIKLLAELGVPRADSDMSFAVSCRKSGYEYSSRGLRGYFAQKRNVLRDSPVQSRSTADFRATRCPAVEAQRISGRARLQRTLPTVLLVPDGFGGMVQRSWRDERVSRRDARSFL